MSAIRRAARVAQSRGVGGLAAAAASDLADAIGKCLVGGETVGHATHRARAAVTLPTATDRIHRKRGSEHGTRPVGSPAVGVYEDATVIGDRGLVRHGGRAVAPAVAPGGLVNRRVRLARAAALREYRPTTSTERPVTPLLPVYQNYHHWLIDVLPRLRQLTAYIAAGHEPPTLIIPDDAPEYVVETLAAVNYPGDCVPYGGPVTGRVVVPSHPEPVVEDLRWLRGQLGQSGGSGGRLLIDRRDAATRQLCNRGPVAAATDTTPLRCGPLSVAEQARRFDSAEVVVGVHGAGLTNILFCRPGTPVVEIDTPPTPHTDSYRRIAAALGFEYHFWPAENRHGDRYAPLGGCPV